MIRVVHPGSGSRIQIFYPYRIPDKGVKKTPDPGSRGQKGTGSRIRIRNHWKENKIISMKARIDIQNYIILAKHRLRRRWIQEPRTGLPPAAAPRRPRCSTSAPACSRTPGTPCSQ
jgi:hypothetical protein